jgi:subtilisin family serine protease
MKNLGLLSGLMSSLNFLFNRRCFMFSKSKIFKFLIFILVLSVMSLMSVSVKSKTERKFNGHPYKEGEILVRVKADVSERQVNALFNYVGAKVLLSSRQIKNPIVPDLYWLKIDDSKMAEVLSFLNSRPEVIYAEPNYIWKAVDIPNDPDFSKLWGLHNTGQTGGTADADIDAPEAWKKSKGSKNVIIAVVDTGVDYTHPDLSRNMWRNPGEIPGNGIDDDDNGVVDDVYGINTVGIDPLGPGCGGRPTAGDPMDDDGHGTHVAGTIGAVGNNAEGVVGVNWRVSIMAVKFLGADGSGTTSAAILGLQYVKMMKDRGFNIIATNNSWGGGAYSRALRDAIEGLMASGILFVAAAGNNGLNNDLSPFYPASYDLPNIISVAATDHNDNLASFSNYGRRSVHVGAPGVNIYSTCSPELFSCYNPNNPKSRYAYFSGTSMAAPHVSGLVALIKAKYPSMTWYQIRNLILSTGDTKTSLQGKTLTEKRINANRALSCSSSKLFEILKPFDNATELVKRPVILKAINIQCENPAGQVTVTIGSSTITLKDDGVYPDEVAGDGIYSGMWTPPSGGTRTLKFSNGFITKSVRINVVELQNYNISTTAHEFNDISSTCTNLSLGDESYTRVDLPFPVKIYGASYTSLYVSDNGALSKDNRRIGYSNYPIPTTSYPNIIAPFWDDLDPSAGGKVCYQTLGSSPNRKFIIQWDNVPHYNVGGTNGVTFQVEFRENSTTIYYRYKDVYFGSSSYDKGASATVGIQRDGSWGNQYSYNTPSLENNTSLSLTPTTVTNPIISVEPEAINFYYVKVGKAKTNKVYITNMGNKALTINSLSISGSSEFSLVSPPTTPFNIAPGMTRAITIKYAPTDEGSDSGTLNITSNDRNISVSLSGYGFKEPDIWLSTGAINFGNVAVGSSKDVTITIRNTGNAPLRITDIDIEAPFSIVGTLPPYTINPGASRTLTIRFAPTSSGTFWYNMIIYSNDPDESAASIYLTGVGQ